MEEVRNDEFGYPVERSELDRLCLEGWCESILVIQYILRIGILIFYGTVSNMPLK